MFLILFSIPYIYGFGAPKPSLFLFPNPFPIKNSSDEVKIWNPESKVSLAIFNVEGKSVKSFGELNEGVVLWNRRDESNQVVPSGIYFMEFTFPSGEKQEKIFLNGISVLGQTLFFSSKAKGPSEYTVPAFDVMGSTLEPVFVMILQSTVEGSGKIGDAGGVIKVNNSSSNLLNTEVSFSPNTLSLPSKMVAIGQALSPLPLLGVTPVGPVVDLRIWGGLPTGKQFKVSLPFKAKALAEKGITDVSELGMYHLPLGSASWSKVPNAVVNSIKESVEASLDQLGMVCLGVEK